MNILIFLLLGFLTSLLFPPYFFLPIGFLIFPFICLFIEKKYNQTSITKLIKYSFIFGFGFFFNFLFWIQNPFFVFEDTKNLFFLSIFLIILLSIIFSGIFTLLIIYNKIIPIIIIVPLVFVITEFVISIIFYGFPWFNFSLVISSNDFILFNIKYFGTLITSYIVIQIFCLPYLIFTKEKYNYNIKYISILIILPLVYLFFNNILIKEKNNPDTNLIDIEIFQLNFEPGYGFDADNRLELIIAKIKKSNSNYLIFSENNYPFLIEKFKLNRIQNILKDGQNVIIGGTRKEEENYYNSLLNITSTEVKYFDKKILVPFGEFLPLRKLFDFFSPISGPNDYSSGSKNRLISLSENLNYIPVICYEIIFYWKLIDQFNLKSNFIVNITNDVWFGKYLGPYQHFYHTKLRAVELNKPIIRVSNNGISGVIKANGKILKTTTLNNSESLRYEIKTNNKKIIYKTHNYLKFYFFIICILLFIVNLKKYNEH